MNKFHCHETKSADRNAEIVDLGAASEETRGQIEPVVFEPFAYLPESGISKD
ncbi:hypothetical protein [Hyphococcus sp.]|uniref:hypothetical protein n=1 Tax=Hyphococcus sp. TaxID=2038636 RepID=UPI0035C68981